MIGDNLSYSEGPKMSRYLLFPVNDRYTKDIYCIRSRDGRILSDFKASYAPEDPVFCAQIDVARFGDCVITDRDGNVLETGSSDRLIRPEEFPGGMMSRPAVHFTPAVGWMNDPNGLVFANGIYHLFFQHNPMSLNHGNMTWGHATSGDDMHWTERGDAVFPDEFGTVFSGSAVCDERNVSGFGKDAIVLFYTAAGGDNGMSAGKRFTQCIAYSTDGGETFTKYEGNPVLGHIAAANRDPKVQWADELGKYIMSLYLEDHSFAVFQSDDLIHWDRFCGIELPDDCECPDLYPLEADGERKWVFSAAGDTYLVGDLTPDGFVPVQEPMRYTLSGSCSYAAQTYVGHGGRRLRKAWENVAAEGAVFRSQISFPAEMFLKKVGDRFMLGSLPIGSMNRLSVRFMDGRLSPDGPQMVSLGTVREDCAAYARITSGGSESKLEIMGQTVSIDPVSNEIRAGSVCMPLTVSGDMRVSVIADTPSLEIYADGGLIHYVTGITADRSAGVTFECEKGDAEVRLDEIKL